MNPFILVLGVEGEIIKMNPSHIAYFYQSRTETDRTYIIFSNGDRLIVKEPASSIERQIKSALEP